MALGELQLGHNILCHSGGSRSRQSQHRSLWSELAKRLDLQVQGAEIVAPLRDTVGLVYGNKAHLHLGHPRLHHCRGNTFGGNIEKLHIAIDAVIQSDIYLSARQARVDSHSVYMAAAQCIHLVFHQRHKRSDHNTQSLTSHRGDLIEQRLTRTRGHQRKCISPPNNRLDDLLLSRAETLVAPPFLQGGKYVDTLYIQFFFFLYDFL